VSATEYKRSRIDRAHVGTGEWLLCVGDGDECEARIGSIPRRAYHDRDAAYRECARRNRIAHEEEGGFWSVYHESDPNYFPRLKGGES
jgi:hypothetical protein